MKQVSKFASFFMFPMIVLFAHLFASQVLNLYKLFPNLDIPFHFAGGLSIAYTSAQILSYLEKEKITAALNQVVFLVLIFSLTATATVFWEFAEFIGDQLLNALKKRGQEVQGSKGGPRRRFHSSGWQPDGVLAGTQNSAHS